MHDLTEIHDLARLLARSGRFCSWRLIAIELRFMEGMREAANGFSDPALREELDALCREAQKRTARWPRPGLQPPTTATSVPAVPRPAPLSAAVPAPPPAPALRSVPSVPQPATTPPIATPARSIPAMAPVVPAAPARPRSAFALEPPPRWVAKYRS